MYAYDPLEPIKRPQAIAVLSRLETLRTGALSSQILGEFFWNATRKLRTALSPEQAEYSVTLWTRSWTVLPLTSDVVLEAIRGARRYQFPYWDALIWATAKLNSVLTVLSEDFSDGSLIEGVRFVNPFTDYFDVTAL